ncbi:MAG: DUF4384 domain-containing protein [Deinococcus sp.]|nr:DUF4384 domain-containing protein [Deinococcus sp.]
MSRHLLLAVLTLGLGTGLSSCTVQTDHSNLGLSTSQRNLILELQPDRGEGARYRQGDEVRLRVSVREPGFLTLLARQPDGSAQVLVRGAYVERGTTVFPRAGDQVTYNVDAPGGLQVVRAVFTRAPQAGTAAPHPADRDVQETFFYIIR